MAYKLGNVINAKNICDYTTKLYKYLPNLKTRQIDDTIYKQSSTFLNYWLNYKLRKSNISANTCVKACFNVIERQCQETFPSHIPVHFIYDIKEDELERMVILFSLYMKYSKLSGILNNTLPMDTGSLHSNSKECNTEYKKAKAMCNIEYSKFCEQLNNFKLKYKELYAIVDSKEENISKNFKRLKENENYVTILSPILATILGITLFFVLFYKFTPIGKLFKPKKKNLTKMHGNEGNRISDISLIDNYSEQMNVQHGRYNIKYHST
ncbi:hypothetical protein PVNG_06327 [Plasmodium vivax North Korean]|uniref:VIR protein n=1 Tax=Plasmodium vivax North Korean TaxID=1035514 RepID=A0A0J9TNR4_PLAVI|nr:hypothetical protein PVNG_06327 [Plasmodium vivax North Korean]